MSSLVLSPQQIDAIGNILNDRNQPLAKRFRSLFTLRNIGGEQSISWLAKAFEDPSALLKHEIAYCLGQMQDPLAIPYLTEVLKNVNENAMVRHEAAEALGAIGKEDSITLLQTFLNDHAPEVRETCEIAIERIKFQESNNGPLEKSPYSSVDPAPALKAKNMPTSELRKRLMDTTLSLFERYRAMFALRDRGDTEAVEALADGLRDSSALFRHEIAYVMGQLQHPAAQDALRVALEDDNENPMVRHEAAEAIGAIATDDSLPLLNRFSKDKADVVRESCEVALDIHKYFNSDEFQYADGLVNSESNPSTN